MARLGTRCSDSQGEAGRKKCAFIHTPALNQALLAECGQVVWGHPTSTAVDAPPKCTPFSGVPTDCPSVHLEFLELESSKQPSQPRGINVLVISDDSSIYFSRKTGPTSGLSWLYL